MAETTVAQHRMNEVYDELRVVLARMHPDKGEELRREIILVLVAIKVEAQKWQGGRKRSPLPIYREGAIWEAVGMHGKELEQAVRDTLGDWTRTLT